MPPQQARVNLTFTVWVRVRVSLNSTVPYPSFPLITFGLLGHLCCRHLLLQRQHNLATEVLVVPEPAVCTLCALASQRELVALHGLLRRLLVLLSLPLGCPVLCSPCRLPVLGPLLLLPCVPRLRLLHRELLCKHLHLLAHRNDEPLHITWLCVLVLGVSDSPVVLRPEPRHQHLQ